MIQGKTQDLPTSHVLPLHHTDSSTSKNTLLSSHQQNTLYDSYTNLAQQDHNALMTDLIQSFRAGENINSFDVLLNYGVSPDLRNSEGKTLLMIAVEKGSLQLAQKLLEFRAQTEIRDRAGKTALYYALEAGEQSIQFATLLLNYGADSSAKSKVGVTPLLRAIEKGSFELANLLLQRGSNPYAKLESTGDTTLHVAAKRDDKQIVKLLLQYRCDPNRENRKQQSVRDVCKGNPEILELLKSSSYNQQDELYFRRRYNSDTLNENSDLKVRNYDGNNYTKKNRDQNYEQHRYSFNRDNRSNQKHGNNFFYKTPSDSVNSNLNNSPDSQNIPSSQANKNDDNCSNASTSYSTAHSEIHAYVKDGIPPFTVVNNLSDDRNIDKNPRSKNLEPFQDKKRRNSGASRTSLTSTPSDMVSDNESASVHSQTNFYPDFCMQHVSPELQERTVSSGSLGGAESNSQYHVTEFKVPLDRNHSGPQNYGDNQDNSSGLYPQRRKNKTYPNSNKSPYQNYSQSNQYYNPLGFDAQQQQQMVSPQGSHYKNKQFYNQNRDYNNNFYQYNKGFKNDYGTNNTHRNSQTSAQNGSGTKIEGSRYSQYQNPGPFSLEIPTFNGHSPNYFYNQSNNYPAGPQEGHKTTFTPKGGYKNSQNQFSPQYMLQPNNSIQNMPMLPHASPVHENNKLRDEFMTIVKDTKDSQKTLENMKSEHTNLEATIEQTNSNITQMKGTLVEKDKLIEELLKKNQELEDSVRKINPDYVFRERRSQGCSTEGILSNFHCSNMEEVLFQTIPIYEPEKINAAIDTLHQEVLDFEKAVDVYHEENRPTHDSLLALIEEVLAEAIPDSKCIIYGSYLQGLALPWSDLDIIIQIPHSDYAYDVLERLEAEMMKKDWIGETKTIQNTTVPLLKVVCTPEYLYRKLDITIQDSRHNGLSCADLIGDYLKAYPPLRALTLVLKHFIHMINMNNTFSGGLSSYGLTLMIVFMFQTKEQQRAALPLEQQNFGELLLSFFQFYGFEHDYYTHFVVNPKKILKEGSQQNDSIANMNLVNLINQQPPTVMQPRIVIQDPISSKNNIGRSTFRISDLQKFFMAGYFEVLKSCTCEVHNYIQSLEGDGADRKIHCSAILRKILLSYKPGQ